MTTIIYKDKKYKLPFVVKSHSTTMVKRTNRLSGESIDLPGFAACVYDYTMFMSEATEEKTDTRTKRLASVIIRMTGKLCEMAWIFSDVILQKNIWCC